MLQKIETQKIENMGAGVDATTVEKLINYAF